MHTHQIKGSISCSKTKCYEIDQQATQCHSEVQCGLVMSTDQIFRPYFSTLFFDKAAWGARKIWCQGTRLMWSRFWE